MIGNVIAGLYGVGVTPFSPTSIANCKLWLDAADTSSITSAGGLVSQWNDKSGNGYNFVQTTSTNKPTTGADTKNSLNLLTFDGTTDWMQTSAAASAFNFLHNTTGSTIFYVAAIDSTSDNNWFLDSRNSDALGGAGYGIVLTINTAGNLTHNVSNGTGSSTNPVTSVGGGLAANTYYYVALKSDPNNATALSRSKYTVNGGAEDGNNTRTGTPSATNASQALVLGSQAAGAYETFGGRIGEIIIYSGIISAGDITDVKDYLAAKWAI
jgi:hypothetical protein